MSNRLYDAYKTAATAEQGGVWVPMAGARFKLARMGGSNVKFQRALSAATRPHLREIQLGMADEKALEEIMLKVFIDTILLDWAGVEDPDSLEEPAPALAFNKDNAKRILSDLPDLYNQLREQAQSFANFLASSVEVAAKLVTVLLYELEQGPLEETLIRRAHAERRPIPEKIASAPQLLPGVGFYLQSFLALSSCRALGMSEGRIPWHAVWDYSQRLGLTEQEFDDLWIVICHADAAYLKYRGDKAKTDAKNRPSK